MKSLVNKSDIQSEGNITVSEDTINTGRILSDKELNIKGNKVFGWGNSEDGQLGLYSKKRFLSPK